MLSFARYIVCEEGNSDIIQRAKAASRSEWIQRNFNMADDKDINEKIAMSFKGWLPKINKENEKAAWRHIFKTANLALHKYPTTVEEDV